MTVRIDTGCLASGQMMLLRWLSRGKVLHAFGALLNPIVRHATATKLGCKVLGHHAR